MGLGKEKGSLPGECAIFESIQQQRVDDGVEAVCSINIYAKGLPRLDSRSGYCSVQTQVVEQGGSYADIDCRGQRQTQGEHPLYVLLDAVVDRNLVFLTRKFSKKRRKLFKRILNFCQNTVVKESPGTV